ncbi:hypothetical protein [Methylogaea oryzae]|uniref:hypothetical protein n=1 Tax=Methylogaea oryzae TaxID=1295382 RepID=UPI0012E205A6|nr:hypothetical protein [Methylogaea oryzae]
MKRITHKLILALLVTALLPLGLVMVGDYRQTREQLTREILHRVRAIADARIQRVESYTETKRQEITALAETPTVGEALAAYKLAFSKAA